MSLDQDVSRYQNFLRQDPGNPHLLMALGELYLRQGKPDEALQCFDQCLAQEPGHAIAHARRAEVLLAQSRFPEAEQTLRSLLADAPTEPALLHNLGFAVYRQARWQEAAVLFQRARDSGLSMPRNVLYLAYALHQLGRLDEALDACRRALASMPDESLDGYLAVLEMDAGRLQLAHAHAIAVLDRYPGNADASLVCGMWHIERQETDQAERFITAAHRSAPLGARASLALGLIHLHRQEYGLAIDAFELARTGMPTHAGTVVTLGWARFAARDLAAAEQTFRDAVELDGSFAEAHGGLAATLAAQGREDDARRAARIARRLDPGNLAALWVDAAVMAARGKPEAGTAALDAALKQPLSADGASLADHIRRYARTQARRGDPPARTPNTSKD